MITAIILAAGQGKRMASDQPKQFLPLDGEPMVLRSLRTFADVKLIDEILLVTSEDAVDYCRRLCAEAEIRKLRDVIPGGGERYESVLLALYALEKAYGLKTEVYFGEEGSNDLPGEDAGSGEASSETPIVLIHDAARPFVTEEIITRAIEGARLYGAAAASVPSKDTVKIADAEGFAAETPARSRVRIMQTPQAFSLPLLIAANRKLLADGTLSGVTDDAMVVERSGLAKVFLSEGAYENVKITTPDDLKYIS